MESERKLKLELLQKELAKKKLKLKTHERRKSAKDHVRQKIKEQTKLYSLPGDGSLGVDVASNVRTAIGPTDSSPSVSVDEPSSADNPRKCCVSFKLTPIHVSIPSSAVDEEVDRLKNSDLIQSDLVNSDLVVQETCVNSGLPLIGDLVTFHSVNCDPLVTSYSQVNSSIKANPICHDVSCLSASSVNTIQPLNITVQQSDSAESNSTLEAEGNQAGVFLNDPEHSEELFAPEDIKSCNIILQCTQTADCGLGSEYWAGPELQGNRSNDGTLAGDETSGLNCSADHNKEFAEKVVCILKENVGCQFNNLHGIYSNSLNRIPVDSSINNHNEPTDLVNEKGDKTDECTVSQMTSERVGNWITNGQEDGLRKLNIGIYLNPLKGILSCSEKEVLEKDISKRDMDGDNDLLVSKVPYRDMDGRLKNPKQPGYFVAKHSQKLEFRSIKTFGTKPELETQSDSEDSKLQKEPDSITGINVLCCVQSDLMAPDNLAKPDQLLKYLPTSTSCLDSQQADISSADLADCMVSEQKINLNSDSFSTSDLSFLDEDNDDLYSRVKARRRGTSAKRSSVDQNPVRQPQTWTSDKRKLLTEVDDGLMPQCETDSANSSCKKFVTQRDDKLFKKDLKNNSVSQSSIDSHSNCAKQPSINLKGNMAMQSTFTECSGKNLLASHLCETVSNYKHDYLSGSSKQFDVEKGSKCAKTSLESNSERHSTCIHSSENSMGVNSLEAFSNCETDNHEGSSENLVILRGRKRVKNSSESSSVNQSSLTNNSIEGSSTGRSSSAFKRVRRSGRLKDRESSERSGLCNSREVISTLPDVDAIRHVLEVVRHNVMDKSQCSEDFSLPDVEYHGCKNVKCNSLFVSQSLLSSQTVENSIQSSVRNLLGADATKKCVSTVDGVNERDENGLKIQEIKMQVVEEMRLDINAISTSDFVGTTDSSHDTPDKLLNHTLTQLRGLDASEMVKKLSNEQSESAWLNADYVQLLDKSSWNIKIQEELRLQSSFEGSTITAGYWSLGDLSQIPVIICCHGNGITVYRKETEKSEWSLWSTWNADADRSVISAWPLNHGSICSLLVKSGSLHETCVEILVFDSVKEQRRLTVDRLAASAGEQMRVCVLNERAFCIGTLCNEESNEWEVMVYSLNADCVAVMPGLALEGKIFHLICMVIIPEESCICGFSSSEVVIWHFATGSLLQKISLNVCVSHCPYVFHENGLLFLPCLLSNNNASGCLVVLNPVSTKTFSLLEYKSPPNDFKQACRFTSSGVGDEFLFAVTDNGTLLVWSLFSGALVARSSGVHVKSATLLKQNTLGVMISNRIITIQLSLGIKQSINNENLLLCP